DLATPPNHFNGAAAWNYVVDPNAARANVVISELLAGNTVGLTDEDGAFQDWIELFNPGVQPVRLLGWALTDDPRNPGRWTFPDVTIGAGQYLIVFASGLDRRPSGPDVKLHTNFKLSKGGEYLGLLDAESPRQIVSEFAPKYPEQRNDYSFGL